MGRMWIEWPCCDSASETDGWSPEECPFCTGHKLRKEIERLQAERDRLYDREAIMAKEMEEQSRIIGMSGEREARHLAKIKKLKEDVHLANGVADLAIKHRDAAEADVVARQALVTRLTQESNMHARACAKVFDELQEVKHERDQIIEMCAKVCDARQAEHRNNYRGRIGDQTKIAETKSCASAIRALKEER